jgi:multiple sugar transport system permease protein
LKTGEAFMMKKKYKVLIASTLFLLPFLILYLMFTIYPMVQGLYMSLYKWTIIRKMDFVGLANYKKMLSDSDFWGALQNTTFFVVVSTPIMVIAALILALISNRGSKFKKLFRVTFFIPSVLTVSVISYLAIFVLQPYTGLLNSFLHICGIKAEPYWLADQHLAWISIIFTTIWWTVGFNMILYLSALQDVSDEIYEAASLDGATKTQSFFSITLPLLKPITKIIVMLQILASFKVFSQILLITNGGPGSATRPIIQLIYQTGFTRNSLGYASAMSYGLFVILVIVTLIQFRVTREREE